MNPQFYSHGRADSSRNPDSSFLQYSVNEMITWQKLMGSAPMFAPNIIFALMSCCDGTRPHSSSIAPTVGSQGTDVQIVFSGDGFYDAHCGSVPILVIDGYPQGVGSGGGMTTNFNARADCCWSDTDVHFTAHIDANATVGAHTVALQGGNGGLTAPLTFYVSCPGCPPPPQLYSVASHDGSPLHPGGVVTFTFEGANLLNTHPQIEVGRPGISVAPGPYNVQSGLGLDYFFADVTADANANGDYSVRIVTDGGRSEIREITVDASQPPPSPSPGSSPILQNVIPTHISKGNSAGAYIQCVGSGFGSRRQVLFGGKDFFFTFATYNADPDIVAVALYSAYASPDTFVSVRVHNLDNDTISNEVLLVLDDAIPIAPAVNSPPFGVNRGSEGDVAIFGTNLLGVTEQSLSPIRGVAFRSVQPCGSNNPQCPGTSPDQGFSVHVSTDATAPFTRDEATNLTISTSNGQSGPFDFLIGVPPGP